jgi:AraC-like DNA-binding protein
VIGAPEGRSASHFFLFRSDPSGCGVITLESMALNPSVSAKNAKEVNLDEVREQFTEDHWRRCGSLVEAALKAIQSDQLARQGLRDLVRAGCNPAIVLHEIAFYGGVSDSWDKKARYARHQLKDITARLENDADILERRIVSEFMKESADQYEGVLHSPDAMRQIARSLKMARKTLTKHTHGKTGTTKHLVYLSYHIKAATRSRHYIEIAKLVKVLDPARWEKSPNLVHLADAIRKEIRGHEKQPRKLFQEERVEIERHLAAWRQQLSSAKQPETESS